MSPVTRHWLAALALKGAFLCLAAGIALPIIEFDRFFVFQDDHSILSMMIVLVDDGEGFLAFLIGLFAIIFPLLKIGALMLALMPRVSVIGKARLATFVDHLSKWSMLDVLVVAILIVTVKISGVQRAATQPGLYFFIGAIVLTVIASRLIWRGLEKGN